MINNYSLFKKALIGFLLAELFSYYCYSIPQMNAGFFLILIIAFLAVVLWRLEYGVLFVLAELFIGSKGYLFFTQIGGFKLSVRIALWSIIMIVWFGKYLIKLRRERGLTRQIAEIKNAKFGLAFALLFLMAGWGLFNGWLHQPSLKNIFLDANAWIYFGLIFPLYSIRKTDGLPEKIWSVFWAAATWLSIKTLFLLYIFSHGQTLLIFSLYHWVRDTGVGEITQVEGGFYRIFIQSQIYNLLAFFISLCWLLAEGAKKQIMPFIREKQTKIVLFLFSLSLITILLSFSRSFWVGAAAGFGTLAVWSSVCAVRSGGAFFHNITHSVKLATASIFFGAILSVTIIGTAITFPLPRPTGGFSAADLFSERLTDSNEAAIGSRWALLPKLWEQIRSAPILGKGFGAEVTYKSQDPRIVKISPEGNYTTSAFEWGWLDIWLKLGIFGLLSYLFLLYKMGQGDWHNTGKSSVPPGTLAIGIIILIAVHTFTPYLNHPLGIGFVIIATALLDQDK